MTLQGRNPPEYAKMAALVSAYNASHLLKEGSGGGKEGERGSLEVEGQRKRRLKVSIEIEKPRPEVALLFPLADVVSVVLRSLSARSWVLRMIYM